MLRLLFFLAALLASPLAAAERAIAPGAFLDLVAGRTVTFVLPPGDVLVGVERFLDRKRSIWTRADGHCAAGAISVHGAKVCFRYDDRAQDPACWWPFEERGELFIRSTQTGEVQRATTFRKRPLPCGNVPAF